MRLATAHIYVTMLIPSIVFKLVSDKFITLRPLISKFGDGTLGLLIIGGLEDTRREGGKYFRN